MVCSKGDGRREVYNNISLPEQEKYQIGATKQKANSTPAFMKIGDQKV